MDAVVDQGEVAVKREGGAAVIELPANAMYIVIQ